MRFFLLFASVIVICMPKIWAQGTGCASAVALTINGSCASGTISDATQDAPALFSCPTGVFRTEGWYKFTVTAGPQSYTITGSASTRNLFLQVISETAACIGLTQIGCANASNINGSQTESVVLNLANGTYYIKVANVGLAGSMALTSLCVTGPPANDLCSGAIPVSCGNSYSGSTANATSAGDPATSCANGTGGTPGAPGVWYSFVGTGQMVTASLCGGASWDTKLHIYSGSCGALTCVNSDDNGCATQSTVTFTTAIGTTYYILVNGSFGSTGIFTLGVSCCTPSVPACASGFIPASGSTGINRCATLGWAVPTPGCGAVTSYSVFFGTSPVPPFAGTTTATSYNPGMLAASTTYYWRIVPVNATGSAVGCITQSYTTNSLAGCLGPGGEGSYLAFWVRANGIVSAPANNTAISTWDDWSGGSRHATQATNANMPVYRDNATDNINYNPVVSLDGIDDRMGIAANGILSSGNNDYAVYAVIAPDNTNTNADPGKFLFSGTSALNTYCAFDARGPGVLNDTWNFSDLAVPGQWTNLESLICTFNYESPQRTMYKNGVLLSTLPSSPPRASPDQNSAIGFLAADYNEHYGGKIAELVSYRNTPHATASREKVESYLGIKYGKTLPHDYYSTAGSVIYSVTSPYSNRIIGIGRDDLTSLIQKQSKTTDDSTRIYKGTLATTNNANGATFLSDVSYVVIGDNAGKLCNTAASKVEVPAACNLYARLEREWKVTNTNFAETFNVAIILNNCAQPSIGTFNTSHLRLLVDDDGNFANGGTSCYANGDGTGVVLSYANPVITVTGISNTHIANNMARYITIASTNSLTPLPVELLSFTAVCDGGKVALDWVTATETNNKQYEIERSTDGLLYTTIATIAGHGNSTQQQHYHYADHAGAGEHYYYRLKQVNLDNTFVYYHHLVSANTLCEDVSSDVSMFPNPANESITIKTSSKSPVLVEILNDCGQLVYSGTVAGDSEERISTAHFAQDIYVVRFVANRNVFVRKLAVTHLSRFG